MLDKRLKQMEEHKNNVVKLEELYYDIAYDIGFLNDQYVEYIPFIQQLKGELKNNCKSIAEFNREYELTETYKTQKTYKYQIKALEKMMAGVRIRVESLRAETKGQY